MSHIQFLLAAIVIQQGLLAVGWLGLIALGLARVACTHWAVSAAMVVAGLEFAGGRQGGGDPWLTYFAANSLAVLAYVVGRRGVRAFCRRPTGDLAQAVFSVLFVGGLAALVGRDAQVHLIIGWTSLCSAWVLLNMGVDIVRGLREEFGRPTALACATPALTVGGMFLMRAIGSAVVADSVGQSLTQPSEFNAAFSLALMAGAMALNLGLVALVVVRAVRQYQRLSDHDALTGLLNRRGFETLLRRERERLRRGGPGFALLSIDVDHFKRINDRYGHSRGDAALVAVAQVLRHTARRVDHVARMGGEEFMVLLPLATREEAFQAAGRTLDAIRDQAHVAAGLSYPMTVSIGIVVSTDGEEALDALLRRLDATLYSAKAAGRDRVADAPSDAEAITEFGVFSS